MLGAQHTPSAWLVATERYRDVFVLVLELCSAFFVVAHFTTNLSRHAMMVAIIISNVCTFNLSIFSRFDFYLSSHTFRHLLFRWRCIACFLFCSSFNVSFWFCHFDGVWVSLLTFKFVEQKKRTKACVRRRYIYTYNLDYRVHYFMLHAAKYSCFIYLPPSFLCFAGCITQRFWQHVCTAFCLHRWKQKYVFMQTSGSFGTEHRKRNNLRQKNTRTHHMWNLYFQRVSNVTVSKLCLPNCVQIDVGEFTLVLYAAGRLLPKQEHKYFATIYTWFTRIFFAHTPQVWFHTCRRLSQIGISIIGRHFFLFKFDFEVILGIYFGILKNWAGVTLKTMTPSRRHFDRQHVNQH